MVRNYIPSIVSGDKTGSLMKYDPKTKQVSVLLSNLSFPNGVALSEHGDFVLVSESTTGKILRLWLRTPKSGTVDVFAEFRGFPDNIKRRAKEKGGGFWVGIHGRRTWVLKWILSHPWIGKTIAMLPVDSTRIYSYVSSWRSVGLGIRVSENGEILEEWEDKGLKFVSEVMEKTNDDGHGVLFFGSIKMPFVAIQKRLHE
ncbi:protein STRICTOSIDINE SYNTHASE-LIKE 10-like [Impatiens glandulifera]|uniref:protein STRICTOSIDINE SYNTHASE-LIKE 10-like n=1 Tax=Impatiens glandulifera TaxID=253017 RepID=UPI001FB0DAC0|nr:protein STRICTOSIDINE SYNTHASE-LIKE 10-like [Impatiens glandulifera]